ncbi:ATP-binding cassette domain-containing protein [Micromonospora sp. NPDC049645]|uniref:ABC transporter ATP-binding protein n=1 Tax=Micromonospora sp. NPDC049645 TaxID=3155508 RepID=UPI0034411A28
MAIDVDALVKRFFVNRRSPGLRSSIRHVLRPERHEVTALSGVSFRMTQGEIVGFLGPNGAGKTSLLKCLSGLLHPTEGSARVLGHVPHRREPAFLRQISLVMGQRNSLFWDLPALDAYEVNRTIYQIPRREYTESLDELVELLRLQSLLRKPVRVLSLGERMRCELAGALLHRPRVLFLDEPTLGLDVTAQSAVRSFLADYNRRYGATILLTSHYMADVTALASRVIVIDHGTLRFDGDLTTLTRRYADHRVVKVRLTERAPLGALDVDTVTDDGLTVSLRVSTDDVPAVAARVLAVLPVEDLSIEEPPIDEVVRAVFADG